MKNTCVNVYFCKNKRVVLLESCGDNFGTVQCIDDNEVFTTYGFNTINFNNDTRVGTIEIHTNYKNFKSE